MTKYNFIGNLIRAGGDAKTVKGNDSGYYYRDYVHDAIQDPWC